MVCSCGVTVSALSSESMEEVEAALPVLVAVTVAAHDELAEAPDTNDTMDTYDDSWWMRSACTPSDEQPELLLSMLAFRGSSTLCASAPS